MHLSVPVTNTMEYINATRVSPLISHVQIKVCYVGQETNRNGTVITKEVATKFGENISGVPIVGFYNEKNKDFEAHNREVVVSNGKYKMVDTTKPYGFVSPNAKVWFQIFNDEGVEHEYLCTEGYIWTEIYKESRRIVEHGNNQSMKLHDDSLKGFWSKDQNSGKDIFIISDGLIENLCILGSNVEPCFEGAQIQPTFDFTEFKATMFSMLNEIKDALNKGGSEYMTEEKNTPQVEEEVPAATEFEKKEDKEEKKDKEQEPEKKEDNKEDEENKKKKKGEDYKCGGGGSNDEKKKEKRYELSEIAEYVSLQLKYDNLQKTYSALVEEHNALVAEANDLRSFKLKVSREEKEAMIKRFSMLSDADKKDVVDNMDTYSLEEIEAKLSVICVRNKVDFSMMDNDAPKDYTLNIGNQQQEEKPKKPDWVAAVQAKENH